jgi:hypothetical protein
MVGTSTGLCLAAGFVVSGAEHSVTEKRRFFFFGQLMSVRTRFV